MNQFGCTTPFGRNLDNICKENNQTFLMHVVNFFCEKDYKSFNIKQCPYPCTFHKINLQSKTMKNIETGFRGTLLILQFNRFVKITETYYSYTDLSLIGELGGYIGLFLGFSVFGLAQALIGYFQSLQVRFVQKKIKRRSPQSRISPARNWGKTTIHQTCSLP